MMFASVSAVFRVVVLPLVLQFVKRRGEEVGEGGELGVSLALLSLLVQWRIYFPATHIMLRCCAKDW